eukprot:884722-Prymnesium_polylepis.1
MHEGGLLAVDSVQSIRCPTLLMDGHPHEIHGKVDARQPDAFAGSAVPRKHPAVDVAVLQTVGKHPAVRRLRGLVPELQLLP